MKRPKRFITITCNCCGRDGWTRQKHYSLLTEEEAGYPVVVEGLPSGFVPMSAMCGSSIYEAVKEGIEFCQTYGVLGVGFEFNGKVVKVTAHSHAAGIVENWWQDVYGETQAESFAKR